MIAFTTRLVLRSMQWVAPFLVLLIWILLALGNPGDSLSNAGSISPAFILWATWMTLIAGNVDDDPHRDLIAAALGSAAKVHALRSASVAAMATLPAGAVSLLVALTGHQPDRSTGFVATVTFAVLMSAALVGISIGTLLHRPLLRHRGAATLLSIAGPVGVLLLPPTRTLLRSLDSGNPTPTAWALVICTIWATAATTTAARISANRSR